MRSVAFARRALSSGSAGVVAAKVDVPQRYWGVWKRAEEQEPPGVCGRCAVSCTNAPRCGVVWLWCGVACGPRVCVNPFVRASYIVWCMGRACYHVEWRDMLAMSRLFIFVPARHPRG